VLYLGNVLSRTAEHPIKRIAELLPWSFAAVPENSLRIA
jgi:hypothetical protein